MHRSVAHTLVAVLLCAGAHVAADTIQPPPSPATGESEAAQRQAQQLQQLRERNEVEPEVRLQGRQLESGQRLPIEPTCQEIRAVRFAGELSGLPELRRALSGTAGADAPEGRCLGAAGIALLAQRAQNALIGLGYVTSRVHALSQDLSGGELVLTIEAGRIADLREFGDGVAIPRFTAAQAIRRDSILNLRDIEQTLENLRRNPDALVNIRISPADLPGYSDILIEYVPRQPLRLRLHADDSGTRATGKVQASATLGWNDPLGLADSAYLAVGREVAGRAPGPRGNEYAMLHYSLPVGYWLLSATANISRQHRSLEGALGPYQYHEMSSQGEVSISRVVQRSASSKTSVSAKAYAFRARNLIDDTELEVQRRRTGGWEAALRHTAYVDTGNSQGTLEARLAFRHGTGAFGAIAAPEEPAGEGSARARVIDSTLHLRMPFTLGTLDRRGPAKPAALTEAGEPAEASNKAEAPESTGTPGTAEGAASPRRRLLYLGQLRAQWGIDPLTPQDRVCIGGRNTVRGFDGERNLCGDQAVIWRNEVSSPIGNHALSVYCAVDAGLVDKRRPDSGTGGLLAGAALGLRAEMAAGKACNLHGEVFVGTPLIQPSGFGAPKLTAGFSVGADF